MKDIDAKDSCYSRSPMNELNRIELRLNRYLQRNAETQEVHHEHLLWWFEDAFPPNSKLQSPLDSPLSPSVAPLDLHPTFVTLASSIPHPNLDRPSCSQWATATLQTAPRRSTLWSFKVNQVKHSQVSSLLYGCSSFQALCFKNQNQSLWQPTRISKIKGKSGQFLICRFNLV